LLSKAFIDYGKNIAFKLVQPHRPRYKNKNKNSTSALQIPISRLLSHVSMEALPVFFIKGPHRDEIYNWYKKHKINHNLVDMFFYPRSRNVKTIKPAIVILRSKSQYNE